MGDDFRFCERKHVMVRDKRSGSWRCETCARERHAEIMAIRAKYLPGCAAGNRFKSLEQQETERIATANAELQALMDGAPIALPKPREAAAPFSEALAAEIAGVAGPEREEVAVPAKNTPEYDRAYYQQHRAEKVGATAEVAATAGVAPTCQKCGEPKTVGPSGKRWTCIPCRKPMAGPLRRSPGAKDPEPEGRPCPKCQTPMVHNRDRELVCPEFRFHKRTKERERLPLSRTKSPGILPKPKPAKQSRVDQLIEAATAVVKARHEVERLELDLRRLLGEE